MSRMIRNPLERQLDEAEGYLMLEMPQRALDVLNRRADWANLEFVACLLKGEALRSLDRFRDALRPLEKAAALRPGDARVALALGWCYKRTNRLAQAIDALEGARKRFPEDGLLRYNLACYWSLAGNSAKALDELSQALELEPGLRSLIRDESDFDSIRDLPEFDKLLDVSPIN